MTDPIGPFTVAALRRLLADASADVDADAEGALPPLDEAIPLAGLGLVDYELFVLVAAVEERYGIDLPADLLGALETVGDLVYFTNANIAHRTGPRDRGAV